MLKLKLMLCMGFILVSIMTVSAYPYDAVESGTTTTTGTIGPGGTLETTDIQFAATIPDVDYVGYYLTVNHSGTFTTVQIVGGYDNGASDIITIYSGTVTVSSGDSIWIHGNEYYIDAIGTVEELQNVTAPHDVIWLNDIDCTGVNFVPLTSYNSTMNGMGYDLTNFYTSYPSTDYIGLFENTEGASIHNFTVTNATIEGDGYVGLIAFGLDTHLYDIDMIDCNVQLTNTGGPLFGMLRGDSTVTRCTTDANTTSDSVGFSLSGNLGGYIRDNTIVSLSRSFGNISAPTGDRVGGLLGTAADSTSIINSYSHSNVTGDASVCGLVGKSDATVTYTNNYAIGTLTGNTLVNGLVDYAASGTMTSSYWDINTTNATTSEGGTGKTTLDMYIESTYSGWDFDTVWNMEGYPVLQFEGLDYTVDPVIIYPQNGTDISSDYPALTNVQFIWSAHSGATANYYQLSRDANYNTVVTSSSTTNNYKTLSLDADDYYFRVRYLYDTGTYSDWTETQFSINATTTDYGTAIQGVVYESISGSQNALTGAKVTVYSIDGDFSADYITGENGFYLFDNLDLDNYGLIASKDGYETSSVNYVNVTDSVTYTKNIALEEENAPNYIYPHDVKFIVTDTSYTRYADATVTIYIGDSATAYKTLTTGADGACGAELSETVEYRIVCVYGDQTIDFKLTPTDETYRIYLDTSLLPDRDRLAIEEVLITITPSEINATHANVYVSYNDNLSETTSLYLYINNSDGGVLASGNIYPATAYNFTIPDYQGNDYIVIVNAEHDTFGTILRQYSIHFNDTTLNIGIWGTWIAVACIMMIAMGAGKADADKAAGGILAIVFIFMAIGWLPHTLSFTTSYTVAFILVVAWHMKNKDRSVSE